ncbi:citrate (Si)-synthase [Maribellus sp. CM-23]|uniref:citrate (Si)-synthase n=1 Tax=Maribellus sp. CM-23 TaxID=2781026 RepID=UPI001F3318D2|nr:citrate (Si)-synthase [Maribellus sp. CM-23]MCE4564023.1 citrate (Si)-synthase [Maribellus sp. CM-23]
MEQFKNNVKKRIDYLGMEIAWMLREHPNTVVGEVSVKQLLGGMRGLTALVCNTSYVDPYRGLFISDYAIPEFEDKLPEEIFYLLCTGKFPSETELAELREELGFRAELPDYLWTFIRQLPPHLHPMTMFSLCVLALEGESVFKQKYEAGELAKSEYWEYMLEDAVNLLAKLPAIAAAIYRIHLLREEPIDYRPSLDWGSNLAHMLGVNPELSFAELVRLYMVLHCDHEGGNVSAFTSRVVNSALSNLYYATSAGLNGLAGPLHGLANQVCLRFIRGIHERFGESPSTDQLDAFVREELDAGRVIPGYGHAVLRVTDPRFTAFMEFGNRHCPNSPYLQTVKKLYYVVPNILKTYKGGKVANPYPNVDAISGTLLYQYGISHFDFYTVMFGISRTFGFCAQSIMALGLNQPIIRPKSVTNKWLMDALERAE